MDEPMNFARLQGMPRSWRRRGVPWIGAFMIGVIAALAAFDIVQTYFQTVENTGRELETQARIIAEQTTRTLQAVDVGLRHISAEHRRERLTKLSAEDLHAYLRDQAVGLIQIDGFAMYDARGDPLAISWLEPGRAGTNIASIPGFQLLRDDPSMDLVVSEAVRSKSDGRWMIPLGRRLQTAAGQFAGVIGARVRIQYFEDFYRNVQLEPGTKITLMHTNGTLMARHPPAEASFGQRFPLFDTMLAAAAAGRHGPMRTVSPVDGVERFATVRMVPDYPLAIIVSRDVAVALAPWRAQALGTAARTVALGALAALFMVLLMRKLARLEKAQASLRAIKERFSLAVAGSDDGIWDWDQKTNLVFASARAAELYGLPRGVEQVQPKDAWFSQLRVHPDDAERRTAALEAHIAGKTPLYESEFRVRHPDDSYRWIRVRGLCVRDAQGRPVRMAGSVSDIDARKRAEEAQRQSEQRYQLAIAGVNHGVWDWDLAADMVFMSARAQELFGREPGEPMRPRREWIAQWTYYPDDRARVRRALSDYLRGTTHTFEMEYRMLHPSGDWRWYHDRGVALRDERGQVYRMAGSIEDITERKRAEAERDRLENQLRQTQRLEAMGTLAGGVAHDFNNILAAILGYGEMAQNAAAEQTPLRRYIDAAMSAGLRAKALVERILAFSRSGMGELVPVHVQSVVNEALEVVAVSLPQGISLERTLACGNAGVMGDPTQLHQVVMNLCANAVHAIKGEGTVAVSIDTIEFAATHAVTTCALPRGPYVRLRVADTGSGIDPKVIDRIFDPFFTTKEVGVGTGLGLSLVHGIVSDLGGGVNVESRPASGATFTVYVPWQCSIAAPQIEQEPLVVGSGETILLVDDEVALVRLGEEMVAKLGYDAVGLSSSTEALALFRAEPERFDAVLSDEAMPGLTGSELTAEIRKIRPNIPVVLMSGYVTPSLSARARDAGVLEVLAKPLASHDIARSLASALRR
jgi:PAS domain S-box-containing protein